MKEYESALILGASDFNLIKRINYLHKIWNLGIRFKKCYLLTGGIKLKHDLNDFINNKSIHLNSVPNTDTDLIIEIHNQLSHNWAKTLKQIKVIPIIAQHKLHRPNTRDTLNAWLREKDEAGTHLVISNQPFIPYQYLVAKNLLKAPYQPETVGDIVNSDITIRVILDSVARCLYEYSQF